MVSDQEMWAVQYQEYWIGIVSSQLDGSLCSRPCGCVRGFCRKVWLCERVNGGVAVTMICVVVAEIRRSSCYVGGKCGCRLMRSGPIGEKEQ